MSIKPEVLGNRYTPEGPARWLFPENHSGEPFTEPGIVVVDGQNGKRIAYGVKDRIFRPLGTHALPGLYDADVDPIIDTAWQGNSSTETPQQPLIGAEAELNIVDLDGTPFSLRNPDGSLKVPIQAHPELWDNTAEVASSAEKDPAATYTSLFQAIGQLALTLEEHSVVVDPASARMQDSPDAQNITPHPYIEAMVAKIGPDRLRNFVGVGIHEHFDVLAVHLPTVSRYVRVLAPFMNLGLLAAPFAYGELVPRLGERLDDAEVKMHDGQPPFSIRYPARTASPNGGVGLHVAHSSSMEALRHADDLLRTGEINIASRRLGMHADVRERYDPPSKHMLDHPGRLELCVKDTGALRIDTLIAYSELSRAVVERLKRTAANGELAIQRLHEYYPHLFGHDTGVNRYAKTQLKRVHRNSLSVAYGGPGAVVEDGMGNSTSARQMLEYIIDFANRGDKPLSEATMSTLRKSVLSGGLLDDFMYANRDANGLPSLKGYYRTGTGTPADWMRARAQALRAQKSGISEATIMRDGTQDRVRSFSAYLLHSLMSNSVRPKALQVN